jgi:hypothetical protein
MLNWGLTLTEIEAMVPFERELWVMLIQKEINRKIEAANRQRQWQ